MTLKQLIQHEIDTLSQERIDLLKREGKIANVRRELERQITLRHIQLLHLH